jgi:hypothetical protein
MAKQTLPTEVGTVPKHEDRRPETYEEREEFAKLSLDEQDRRRGVKHFTSLEEYRRHNPFSSDEEIDEFIASVRAERDRPENLVGWEPPPDLAEWQPYD